MVVEDPLPAGTEAIDTSLKHDQHHGRRAEGRGREREARRPGPWWWTPTHTELRDEKVALFATDLTPAATSSRYQIRASLPGEFLTLPPTAYQMYFPEVWGTGRRQRVHGDGVGRGDE